MVPARRHLVGRLRRFRNVATATSATVLATDPRARTVAIRDMRLMVRRRAIWERGAAASVETSTSARRIRVETAVPAQTSSTLSRVRVPSIMKEPDARPTSTTAYPTATQIVATATDRAPTCHGRTTSLRFHVHATRATRVVRVIPSNSAAPTISARVLMGATRARAPTASSYRLWDRPRATSNA